MKKRTIVGLVISSLLIALFAASILKALQDEPPPDVSDLEIDSSVSVKNSFRERIIKGELSLPRDVWEEVGEVYSRAYNDNPGLSYPEIRKKWDTRQMDEALAKMPPEFWKNFDSILQATPERKVDRGELRWFNISSLRVVGNRAIRLAQQGDADAGLRLAAKMALFGRLACESSCSSIDWHMALSIRSNSYVVMGEIVGNYPVSSECLREVRQFVKQTRVSNDEVRGMIKGDFCYMSQIAFVWYWDSISTLSERDGVEIPSDNFLAIPFIARICPPEILIRQNETIRRYAELVREVLAWPDYTNQQLNQASATLEDQARQYRKGRFPYDPVNAGGRLLLPYMVKDYRESLARHLQVESMASAVEAMLAAREYELQQSVLPESLDKLVSAYFSAVPVDYIDGHPIRYSLPARAIWTIGSKYPIGEPLPNPANKDAIENCIFRLLPLPNREVTESSETGR
ncbi:MAG: hypothetical protein LBV12_11610 [Puniceicoccales bacterium]|jgi:hypothetical protein|nr:hypothetical protein [Puniceicoccales bacterium]